MVKITLSQPQCSFGEFVLFNILFNVFVHLGHDSLLFWILFLAVASWLDFSIYQMFSYVSERTVCPGDEKLTM